MESHRRKLALPSRHAERACYFAVAVAFTALAVSGCGTPVTTTPATPPAAPAAPSQWPLFRGNAAGQGIAHTTLPDKPTVLWKVKFKETAFEATAVIEGDTAYVGDGDRAFHAVALADGKKRWSAPVDQGCLAAAAVWDGRIFVGDAGGVFHCFDVQDGKELWRFPTEGAINSSPNVLDGTVLFGSQDGSLYRLRCSDGSLVWKFSITADGGIQSSPTLTDGRVMFTGCDGNFYVLNAAKGERISMVSLRDLTLASAALVGPNAYFGTHGGEFVAINWQTSAVLWTYRDPQNEASYYASAAASTDWVIVAGRNKAVQRFRPSGGDPQWGFSTAGRIDSSPVVAGQRVYFGSADGRVYALALDSGDLVWKHDTGGGISASPAVAQGRLVIGNENGVLYCFGK